MATRRAPSAATPAKRSRAGASATTGAKRAVRGAAPEPETGNAPERSGKRARSKAKPVAPAKATSATAKRSASKSSATKRSAVEQAPTVSAAAKQPTPKASAAQRERRFNLLLQTSCLKAGTAAAFSSITAKVPLLGRLAPLLLGSLSDAVSLPTLQKTLVRDVLALYAVEFSDAEERGVILLATGANLGAQMLSEQMAQQILGHVGSGYLRSVALRILPLASIATDIAAAVATTYTVGKRAQVLCNLPGTGANNLSELLRGLSVIDQRRLYAWSGEALRLALRPFRSVLLSLR